MAVPAFEHYGGEEDMEREITIGEKKIPMRATAGTAYRYERIFGEKLINAIIECSKDPENAENVETCQKLAYVLQASAAREDMNALSFDKYIDWLDNFDTIDLVSALPEILGLYIANRKTKSIPKKKDASPSGK